MLPLLLAKPRRSGWHLDSCLGRADDHWAGWPVRVDSSDHDTGLRLNVLAGAIELANILLTLMDVRGRQTAPQGSGNSEEVAAS